MESEVLRVRDRSFIRSLRGAEIFRKVMCIKIPPPKKIIAYENRTPPPSLGITIFKMHPLTPSKPRSYKIPVVSSVG